MLTLRNPFSSWVSLLHRTTVSCYGLRRLQCSTLPLRHATLGLGRARGAHTVAAGRRALILGIETSCDDTGCAVVNTDGRLLGEALHSQMQVHLNHGGIIPGIARYLHAAHIERVVAETLQQAGLQLSEVDAVAVTVRPGLSMSLHVGLDYAKMLCRREKKPLIPIHHMEAHALTARMVADVPFPFLVLLISGGHSLLSVARNVDDFLLLGTSLDNAPGEALDKAARRLKLKNLPALANMSSGRAIETLARDGNPLAFELPRPMQQYSDCSFSFAGLRFSFGQLIEREEKRLGTSPSSIVDTAADICASIQLSVARHLCQRTQRAMEYCLARQLLEHAGPRRLVVSGGVACNQYIASCLQKVCDARGFRLIVPPPALCTDNGVMIAWNGAEKWSVGRGVVEDSESVDFEPKAKFGVDGTEDVRRMALRCKWVKLVSSPPSQVSHPDTTIQSIDGAGDGMESVGGVGVPVENR